jgi:hypothetical protein
MAGSTKEWIRLSRQMISNEGRWGLLVLVHRVAASPEAVAGQLDVRWPDIRRVHADAARHPDWMALEDSLALATTNGARAIQVFGFDHWLLDPGGDWLRKLSHMNFRREGFCDRVPVPLLWWMRPDTIRRMSLKAVDLWSWRAALFHLVDD